MITMKITCSYLEVVSPAGRGKHKIRSHVSGSKKYCNKEIAEFCLIRCSQFSSNIPFSVVISITIP